MEQPYTTAGWPFAPVPRGARITAAERARRQAALAQAPLFANLSRRQLRSLTDGTAVVPYEQGEEVVKQGSPGSSFFVLLEGKAKVVRSGRALGRLSPGDFFGEISVLDGGPRTATVIADTPLRCLTLDRKDFTRILLAEPKLALEILWELAGRLRRSERTLIG